MTAQELKNSILQLAIQGKLVPQDPNDEPATVLLEKIKEERNKLIKEKKIKKEKYSEIYKDETDNHYYEKFEDGTINDITDEIPFEIPDSWCWVRCINLFNIVTGKKDANFGNENGKYNFYTCSNTVFKSPSYSFDGEYLIMPGNGANVGKVTLYNGKFEAYQRTYVINQIIDVLYLKYVYYNLMGYWDIYNKNKQYGSAIPYIKLGNIQNYLLAIPPLNEQKRIVEKIELIIPYITKYNDLNKAFEKLNNSYKEDLKKSILQYAIQGKLVPQNSNGESADILVNKILEEKRKLIKEKQIKKENLSVIYKDDTDNQFYEKFDDGTISNITDEIPFDIPNSWKWIRLNNLGVLQTGTTPSTQKKEYFGKDIPFIKPGDIYYNKIDYNNEGLTPLGSEKSRIVETNSILMVCIGGSMGKSFYVDRKVAFNQQINAISVCEGINYKFLYYTLISEYFYKKMKALATGTATQIINKNTWGSILVPICSLTEQTRIVQKIDLILNNL